MPFLRNETRLQQEYYKKTKWETVLLFIMILTIACLPVNFFNSAIAEDKTTLLYAIPSVSNTYEQTYNTFTLSNCYPAHLLNQKPTITDCQEDPNGLTWVIFAFEHGDVQLTGKDSHGKWRRAVWTNVESNEMLFICYCLCEAFGSVYKDNSDFAICLYSDSGNHSYIANKASADNFIDMIDSEYGDGKYHESNDDTTKIGKGTNDPILSLFPGLTWKMEKSDMISKYGSDMITDVSDEEHNVCISMVDIYDEGVIIMFSFEDEKLESIVAIYSEEKTNQYLTDMMKDYGKPIRSQSIYGFMDEIKEVRDGDVAIWRTNNSTITITLRDAGSVTYRPFKL